MGQIPLTWPAQSLCPRTYINHQRSLTSTTRPPIIGGMEHYLKKVTNNKNLFFPTPLSHPPWFLPLLLLPLTTNLSYSQQPRRIWTCHFPKILLPLLAPKINTLSAPIVSSPPSLDQTLKYSFHQDSPHISTYTVLTVIMKPTTIYNSSTNSHLSF